MTPHWTNALPPHWKVRRLKHIADLRLSNADKKTVEGEQPIRLCNYVDVYKHDFIVSTMPFMEATASDSQIWELALRAGDVLITKDSEEWNDIAVPAYVPADLPGVICGYHLAHIRPDPEKAFGGYLFRAFAAQGIADQFKVAANGITRYGVSKDDIASALFPVPPVPEQRAIAAFLDRKTAEIDAVVAKKQRIIDLLREERQAMICRAVTRGLTAGMAMKDTGIPWVGDVPQHWRVERLKFSLCLLEQGWSPQCDIRPADDDEWGVLKVGCVNRDQFDPNEQKALPLETSPEVRYEIQPDDILVSRGNTRELVGSAALVPAGVRPQLLLCDLLYRLRVNRDVADPAFVVYQLRSPHVRFQIEREANGTSPSMKKIGQETITDFIMCMPDLAEQRAICAHIERETGRIDGLIGKNESQITKLREYRQALISAAVTGKLAVQAEPTPVIPVKPAKKPVPAFRRAVFAAEIVAQMKDDKHFGHVKFQKCFFTLQHHLRLEDFEENYHRMAAGPHDNTMIRSVDGMFAQQKWFQATKTGERYVYEPLANAGGHSKYFDGWFGAHTEELKRLLDLFRPLDTERTEIVATLYAAWNDFLLLGEPFDDDRIIDDVLTNWHESKQKISRDRWKTAIVWMRDQKLIPHGFGKPTRPASSEAQSSRTVEEEANAGDESVE